MQTYTNSSSGVLERTHESQLLELQELDNWMLNTVIINN